MVYLFYTTLITVDLAQCEMLVPKFAISGNGGIRFCNMHLCRILNTVKPVLRGHPREGQKVAA